jgi:hypothetical protein
MPHSLRMSVKDPCNEVCRHQRLSVEDLSNGLIHYMDSEDIYAFVKKNEVGPISRTTYLFEEYLLILPFLSSMKLWDGERKK